MLNPINRIKTTATSFPDPLLSTPSIKKAIEILKEESSDFPQGLEKNSTKMVSLYFEEEKIEQLFESLKNSSGINFEELLECVCKTILTTKTFNQNTIVLDSLKKIGEGGSTWRWGAESLSSSIYPQNVPFVLATVGNIIRDYEGVIQIGERSLELTELFLKIRLRKEVLKAVKEMKKGANLQPEDLNLINKWEGEQKQEIRQMGKKISWGLLVDLPFVAHITLRSMYSTGYAAVGAAFVMMGISVIVSALGLRQAIKDKNTVDRYDISILKKQKEISFGDQIEKYTALKEVFRGSDLDKEKLLMKATGAKNALQALAAKKRKIEKSFFNFEKNRNISLFGITGLSFAVGLVLKVVSVVALGVIPASALASSGFGFFAAALIALFAGALYLAKTSPHLFKKITDGTIIKLSFQQLVLSLRHFQIRLKIQSQIHYVQQGLLLKGDIKGTPEEREKKIKKLKEKAITSLVKIKELERKVKHWEKKVEVLQEAVKEARLQDFYQKMPGINKEHVENLEKTLLEDLWDKENGKWFDSEIGVILEEEWNLSFTTLDQGSLKKGLINFLTLDSKQMRRLGLQKQQQEKKLKKTS